MSIASEISRISGNVSDSLDAVAAKGVTVPSGSNSDDLAGLIAQISTGSGAAISIVDTLDANGGTIRTITGVSLAGDTVTASHLERGYTAHDALGNAVTGTLSPGGQPNLQVKTNIDPTTSSQTIEADTGYDGLSSVQINAMASGSATTPATSITANPSISVSSGGLITATASATKSVTPTVSAGYVASGTAGTITVSGSNTSQLTTQAGSTISPTESVQTAVASGTYTTGDVKIGAISSTYVGSGITSRSSTDLSDSGATVTAPAGYYAEAASKSVSSMTLPTSASSSATSGYSSKATIGRSTSDQYINIPTGYNPAGAYYKVSAVANGTEGTPTASKGSVSNHSVSVTPSVTNSAGYISGSTKTGTAVTVTASELASGNKEITANGTNIDVVGYSTVSVNVSGGSGKNIQYYMGRSEISATSYTATNLSITVSVAGTYKCYWTMDRNTTSGTSGTQLYKNNNAVGSAHTSWTYNNNNRYGMNCEETLTLAKNDVLVVRARSRSTSYICGAENLIIIEQ